MSMASPTSAGQKGQGSPRGKAASGCGTTGAVRGRATGGVGATPIKVKLLNRHRFHCGIDRRDIRVAARRGARRETTLHVEGNLSPSNPKPRQITWLVALCGFMTETTSLSRSYLSQNTN